MAEITLTGLWVHEADQPALRWRHYRTVRALTRRATVDGAILTTASGRRIARRRPGRPQPLTVTIRAPRDDVRWLAERAGRTLLWRDHAGTVLWGVVWETPETEIGQGRHLVDLDLTIEPVADPYPLAP